MRNSRIGFRLKGPETENIKSSALAEMDFLGNQPLGAPNPLGTPAVTEAAFFNNPTFRVRHYMLKMETPIVDLMAGQYWELFGWQSYFHPNTVELQGVPGQILLARRSCASRRSSRATRSTSRWRSPLYARHSGTRPCRMVRPVSAC